MCMRGLPRRSPMNARTVALFMSLLVLDACAARADDARRGQLLERVRARLGSRATIERTTLGGVDVAIWRPAVRPAPLVIFSHGLHGMAAQSTFLTQALAEHGYLVIAPEHRDSMRSLFHQGLK